jgi:DNA-binding Lrp family transcriptional regulator
VLFGLVRDARRSDRELSRVLGTTTSSVTRRRRELELEGVIRDYTIVADFRKLGFEVEAFSFVSTVGSVKPEQLESLRRLTRGCSYILFAGKGAGLDMNCVIVSLHENYDGYLEFVKVLRAQPWLCGGLQGFRSFVRSTDRSQVFLPFSLRGLEAFKFGVNDASVEPHWIAPAPTPLLKQRLGGSQDAR